MKVLILVTQITECMNPPWPLTTDMMGIGTPKMDGSVEPKSWLVGHMGEIRDNASSHTLLQFSIVQLQVIEDWDWETVFF